MGPVRGEEALLSVRLRAALDRLFQAPEKILEIGIKAPPKEVEESRAELRRFFRGARLRSIDVPFPSAVAALAAASSAAASSAASSVDPGPAEGAVPVDEGPHGPGIPGGPDRSGRFEAVEVEFEGLTLMKLRIDRAGFTLRGLEVDPEPLARRGELRILGLDSIDMRFRVEDKDLDLVSDGYRVTVTPGRFTITGKRKLLVLPIGFVASGLLRFTPRGQIHFHDRSLTLAGLPLPALFRRALRGRINPIFDMESYLGAAGEVVEIRFRDIRHLEGALELTAEAKVGLENRG